MKVGFIALIFDDLRLKVGFWKLTMQVGLGDVEFVELIFMTNNDKSWSLKLTMMGAGLWHEQEVRLTDRIVHLLMVGF